MNEPVLSRTGAALFAVANGAAVFAGVRLYTQGNDLWPLTAALLMTFDLLFVLALVQGKKAARSARQAMKAVRETLERIGTGEAEIELTAQEPQLSLALEQMAARIEGLKRELDDQRACQEKLMKKAKYDCLTQTFNRETLMEYLEQALSRARQDNGCLTILFLDIDDFKIINDSFGHVTGDLIIRFVSDIIKNTICTYGFCGRMGGDEFVIGITDPREARRAENLAMKLLTRFREGMPLCPNQGNVCIRSSIGIASYPENGVTVSELISAADAAMYQIKNTGKDGFSLCGKEKPASAV